MADPSTTQIPSSAQVSKTKSDLESVVAVWDQIKHKADAANESSASFFSVIKDNISNLDFLNKSLLSSAISVGLLAKKTEALNGIFGKYTDGIQNGIQANKEFGKAIADTFFDADNLVGKVIVNFTNAATAAAGFEDRFVTAAMKGGNFFDLLSEKGGSFSENLDDVLTKSVDNLATQSTRMGVSLEEGLNRTMGILSTMPEEYNKIYQANVGMQSMALTTPELLSYTAKGVGISFKDAADMATKMISTFGMSAEKASERIAFIGETSKKLKVPFDTVKGLVTSVDSAFSLWGDQMEGTVGILGRVSSGLKDSGVGFEQQQRIVTEITNSISRMNLQTRAFLGMQAGVGKSAIGAGLKVERMLQEGKIDEIAKMMQQTIEQRSGGKVVSLTEAEQSPDQERRFMVQRQMMSSMFGISDTATANRIMEVMSKGAIAGGEKANLKETLSDAMGKGKQLTDRQVDYNSLIAENTKTAAISLKQIELYSKRREISSQTQESVNGFFDEANKLFVEQGKKSGTFAERSSGAQKEIPNLSATYSAKFASAMVEGSKGLLNFGFNNIAGSVPAKIQEINGKIEELKGKKNISKEASKELEGLIAEKSVLEKALAMSKKGMESINKSSFDKLNELANRETPLKPERAKKTMQAEIGNNANERAKVRTPEITQHLKESQSYNKNEPVDVHIVIEQNSDGSYKVLADKFVSVGKITGATINQNTGNPVM